MNGTTGARAEDTKEVGEGVQKWEGISEIILGHKEWFDAWVEGEKRCKSTMLLTIAWRLTPCAL